MHLSKGSQVVDQLINAFEFKGLNVIMSKKHVLRIYRVKENIFYSNCNLTLKQSITSNERKKNCTVTSLVKVKLL